MLPFSAVASAPTRVLTNRPSPAQLPTPSSSQPLSSTTVTRAGKQAGSSAIREKKHIVTSNARSVSPPIDVASLTPVAAADIVVEEPTSADIVEQLVVGAEAAESASSQQQEQQEQAGEPATVASAASAAAPAAAGDDDARSVAGSVAAGSVCTTATGASTSLRHRHASSAAAAAALKEHDAVSIKRHTSVKDAAGAVVKVLNRLHTLIVTALRTDDSHDALNRTVKSLAVARKYVKDEDPSYELTFQVFNRRDADGAVDPDRFGFFVFKLRLGEALKTADETELNVGRSSDPNRMANAVISVILGRGQAVMKAGGPEALAVGMAAVVNARQRLKRRGVDIMVVPAFITEDTSGALGRQSKFLQFNLLRCPVNGPLVDPQDPLSYSFGSSSASAAATASASSSSDASSELVVLSNVAPPVTLSLKPPGCVVVAKEAAEEEAVVAA